MSTSGRVAFWVLTDTCRGRTIYFRDWTDIGPRGTADLKHAERFKTREGAVRSPAFSFSLTFYEPLAIRTRGQRQ